MMKMRTKWREQQAKARVHSPVQELKHLPGQPQKTERPEFSNVVCRGSKNRTAFIQSILSKRVIPIRMEQGQNTQLRVAAVSASEKEGVKNGYRERQKPDQTEKRDAFHMNGRL